VATLLGWSRGESERGSVQQNHRTVDQSWGQLKISPKPGELFRTSRAPHQSFGNSQSTSKGSVGGHLGVEGCHRSHACAAANRYTRLSPLVSSRGPTRRKPVAGRDRLERNHSSRVSQTRGNAWRILQKTTTSSLCPPTTLSDSRQCQPSMKIPTRFIAASSHSLHIPHTDFCLRLVEQNSADIERRPFLWLATRLAIPCQRSRHHASSHSNPSRGACCSQPKLLSGRCGSRSSR